MDLAGLSNGFGNDEHIRSGESSTNTRIHPVHYAGVLGAAETISSFGGSHRQAEDGGREVAL